MKKVIIALFCLVFIQFSGICQTNDFYDDAETVSLGIPEIEVTGEIANPGKIDLKTLQLHSVVVKETRFNDGSEKFVGAYRYDGYSLYDILNLVVLQKKNEKEFKPIIDLYVEVENDRGEKAVFSWGELYYATHRHEIIVATQVARIVPSKTKDLWPLPVKPRLIVGADLFTERNLIMPKTITVKSYNRSFVVNKGMRNMYAPSIKLYKSESTIGQIDSLPKDLPVLTYPSVFYGRGTGIHKTTPFSGVLLKDLLKPYYKITSENLRNGFLVINAKDGYRSVFSVSEIFNRNDQAEMMIYQLQGEVDEGKFKIFPAPDFFSDRAIKSVESIYFESVR